MYKFFHIIVQDICSIRWCHFGKKKLFENKVHKFAKVPQIFTNDFDEDLVHPQ